MSSNNQKSSYYFVSPYLIFIIILVIYPILITLSLAAVSGNRLIFLHNYKDIFGEMYFSRVLINTIIWTASSVIIIVLINIFLALLLNQNFAGRNVFRIIILVLPWATPDIVAAVSWKWMYNSMYGLINNVLLQFKFPISQIDWLGAPNLALFSVILANIWKGYPIGTMIMLAAYQTIHPEIYEAAEIDGCTGLRSLFRITLPIIRSTLFSLLLISVIWTINYFPLIYIMTGGGPAHRTDTLVTIAYRESFTFLNFNKGSGIILLVFAVTCVFAFLYIKVLLGNGEKQD